MSVMAIFHQLRNSLSVAGSDRLRFADHPTGYPEESEISQGYFFVRAGLRAGEDP